MSTHAQLSPSKRSRWALCPGSIREEAKYPDERSGAAAIDGTHSHTLLEYCVQYDRFIDPMTQVGAKFEDDDGDFVVDQARAERVKIAVDYVMKRVEEEKTPFFIPKVLSEERVDPQWLLGRDDLSGTVDVQIHGYDMLELIDYKDGMGVVEAKGNMQLEQYAYGVLAGFKLPVNGDYPFKTVRMTIIQPKLALKGMNPISSWDVPVRELLTNMGTIVLQAAATDKPDAPLVPGESQCKFCRAKGSCAALAGNVMKEVGIMFQSPRTNPPCQADDSPPSEWWINQKPQLDVAQQSADKDPSTMDAAQLAQIIEAAPLMRQLLEAVEKEAQRRLEAGQSIPGLKLVHGRGSRAWNLPEDQIAEKLIKMGIPKGSVYETKLVSPAKAEKLTWEKRDGTKVSLTDRQLKRMDQEYVAKLAGKLTVAPESDSRPAVITNAAPMFSAVEAEAIKYTLEQPAAESLPSWLS